MGPRTSSTLPTAVWGGCEQGIGREDAWLGGGEETYLVLEVDRGIEVRDLGVGRLNHHLALAGVDELAHLEDGGRRAHVALLETETAAACVFSSR